MISVRALSPLLAAQTLENQPSLTHSLDQRLQLHLRIPTLTRHAIRGIINGADFQAVLVDTPGVHKPKTLLGHRLNAVVGESLDSVDVILMCLPADETSGAGDIFVAQEIAKHPRAKKFALVTKTDLVSKKNIAERLLGISELAVGFTWDEIIPISAAIHDQIDLLASLISKNLSAGPSLLSHRYEE